MLAPDQAIRLTSENEVKKEVWTWFREVTGSLTDSACPGAGITLGARVSSGPCLRESTAVFFQAKILIHKPKCYLKELIHVCIYCVVTKDKTDRWFL